MWWGVVLLGEHLTLASCCKPLSVSDCCSNLIVGCWCRTNMVVVHSPYPADFNMGKEHKADIVYRLTRKILTCSLFPSHRFSQMFFSVYLNYSIFFSKPPSCCFPKTNGSDKEMLQDAPISPSDNISSEECRLLNFLRLIDSSEFYLYLKSLEVHPLSYDTQRF